MGFIHPAPQSLHSECPETSQGLTARNGGEKGQGSINLRPNPITVFYQTPLPKRGERDRKCQPAAEFPAAHTHQPPERGSVCKSPATWEDSYETGPFGARVGSITTSPKMQTKRSHHDKFPKIAKCDRSGS